MTTIESKVADAILQRSTNIEIDGVQYCIAPPSAATLILVSEAVASIPVTIDGSTDNIVLEVLRTAKYCRVVGTIVAILILGAERVNERNLVELKRVILKKRFSWRKMRVTTTRVVKYEMMEEKDALAERILFNCRPSVIKDIIGQRLNDNEVSDFFGITTSLSEANILKATKEVVKTTTSGQ